MRKTNGFLAVMAAAGLVTAIVLYRDGRHWYAEYQRVCDARAAAEGDAARLRADAERHKKRADDLVRTVRADHVWLVGRWNVAASRRIPVELDPPFGRATFTWDGQNFPHPTFKGGTVKAYAAFAGVLQTFLESDDNFDQLVKRGLLDTPLRAGGPGDGSWTFRQLITQFSLTNNFSTPDAEVCRVIRSYRDRMPWAAAENAEIRRRVEELNRKVD